MKKIFLSFFLLFGFLFANSNIIKIETSKRYIDLSKYIKETNNVYINLDKEYYNLLGFNVGLAKNCKIINGFLICNFNKNKIIDLIIQQTKNNEIVKTYKFEIIQKQNLSKTNIRQLVKENFILNTNLFNILTYNGNIQLFEIAEFISPKQFLNQELISILELSLKNDITKKEKENLLLNIIKENAY